MSDIPSQQYFYACDGSIIRSLEELFLELQHMPEHVFSHHVNEERNDFHSWINDVFGNYKLAQNLKDARTKDDVLRHVFVSLFR
ncbi:hypothetical protein ACFL1B_03900 [Nanoarchaeota archaeon]